MKNTVVAEYRNKLVGKEFETNNYGKCVVVGYEGSHKVTVKFYEPECLVVCEMGGLRKGKVRNPLTPNFYKKGYIGLGKYNGRDYKRSYVLWTSMLTRSYCKIYEKRQPRYKDVTVCEEWLNFQNFAAWCETQEFFNDKDDKGKSYQLDKDILVKGNKVYSPETCCFVPSYINSLVLSANRKRGVYPVGVHKRKNHFGASMSIEGSGSQNLGSFESPEEAFQVYKKAKENNIKCAAEKYKDFISHKLYEALCKYEVEITD